MFLLLEISLLVFNPIAGVLVLISLAFATQCCSDVHFSTPLRCSSDEQADDVADRDAAKGDDTDDVTTSISYSIVSSSLIVSAASLDVTVVVVVAVVVGAATNAEVVVVVAAVVVVLEGWLMFGDTHKITSNCGAHMQIEAHARTCAHTN